MDAAFGKLMKAVDDLDLRDTTMVFFTSDNGPAKTAYHPSGSAGPLRDKKGYISDGGIRVPGIIRWPGKIPPESQSDTPVIGTDILPTFCEIAGIAAPQDRVLDGASILPLLKGQPIDRRTPLYWHFYAASGRQKVAIRIGDWKLAAELDAEPVRDRGGVDPRDQQTIKTAGLGEMELYNLKEDIGETTDLKSTEPTRFVQMRGILEAKYREVQRETPTWPAWEFARYEGQRIAWPPYRGARSTPPRTPLIPPVYHDNPALETIE
jgi:arylsulfatase A